MKVAIIGSGAFGTAIGAAFAQKAEVILWSRSEEQVADILANRRNDARLPVVTLPQQLTPTTDMTRALACDVLLITVPLQKMRTLLSGLDAPLTGKIVVACCKGIELESGLGPVSIIEQVVPQAIPALLTGPSFADEIARGLPTALTLACKDAQIGADIQARLSTDSIRLYRVTDTIGAELGGALKNVIAIACGAVMGAGLGNSARAALMTRGYAEMLRLVQVLGGQTETLAGLSGFGDLVLTCGSDQSRNYRLGYAIGHGEVFDPGITVEGAATASAVRAIARDKKVDMPITEAVAALVEGEVSLNKAIQTLLRRSLKEE